MVGQVAVVDGAIWQVVVRRLVEGVQRRELDGFRRPRPRVVVHHDVYHKILRHR